MEFTQIALIFIISVLLAFVMVGCNNKTQEKKLFAVVTNCNEGGFVSNGQITETFLSGATVRIKVYVSEGYKLDKIDINTKCAFSYDDNGIPYVIFIVDKNVYIDVVFIPVSNG